MTYLLLATGFTGALTLLYLLRLARDWWYGPTAIDVYHSPNGGCTDAIVREIGRARKEVLVQAYSFTSKAIAQALLDAKARGVNIEILLDKSNEEESYSELGTFLENGLVPLIDAQHAIAHNKVMIIDRAIVVTGSFNFTRQAEIENAENVLIVKGKPGLIQAYRQNFLAHKSHCEPAKARPATVPMRKAA